MQWRRRKKHNYMDIIKLADQFFKFAYIKKEVINGETYYVIHSEKNKNWTGGKYKSRKAAEKRLKQIEMFKHLSNK
jgi:hypothetical protein